MDSSLPTERLLGIIQTQNDIIATALDLDAIMRLVAARAQGLTGACAAVVELSDGEEMVYHAACGAAAECTGTRVPFDSSLSGLCVRLGEILHCRDAEHDERVDGATARRLGARSVICVPLRHGMRVVGALSAHHPEAHAFGPQDVTTLSLLSGVIAAHMSHASDVEDQPESRHDTLTGLPNWRCFDERLGAEIARVRRHGGELSLAVFDLDGFKEINESVGHTAANRLLRAVAGHLSQVREEDTAFRMGGDEFALLLVGSSEADATQVVERIKAGIDRDPACRGITISGGAAALSSVDSASGLVARADAAMYADKRAQRAHRQAAAGQA